MRPKFCSESRRSPFRRVARSSVERGIMNDTFTGSPVAGEGKVITDRLAGSFATS